MKRIYNTIKRIIANPRYLLHYYKTCKNIAKMWAAFICVFPFRDRMNKKNIWIIREKSTEARDNGFHFFKYIRKNHPEINAYYAITKNSADWDKVNIYQNVIVHNSFKHYMYFLSAKASISSQPFGAVPEPTEILYRISKNLKRRDQITIHLKHGITKDELPHALDYQKTKFDLVCCVSERERKFMQDIHGYPNENIKALGFCRYDTLLNRHEIKKQILVMPTHRMWLHAADPSKKANEKECNEFIKTDFFLHYSELLKDTSLLNCLEKENYKMVFYPHYALQSFIHCFDDCANNTVIIADRDHYDVQHLLMESALLITDFSSVFFDFAYMGKPEIFFQFDEQQYRSGHFKKGYFDYYRDGFGPVYNCKEDVIAETIRIIERGCVVEGVYTERVNDFFTVRDSNNCKRIFDEVYRKAKMK